MRASAVIASVVLSAAVFAQAPPQPPPGITRDEVLDNATALVARLRMEPASRGKPKPRSV